MTAATIIGSSLAAALVACQGNRGHGSISSRESQLGAVQVLDSSTGGDRTQEEEHRPAQRRGSMLQVDTLPNSGDPFAP
jgi:hypothetical protein